MELAYFENLLIAALRIFNRFLNKNGYNIDSISYGERDGDFIKYRSYINSTEIHLVFTWVKDGMSFDTVFYKRGIFKRKWFNLEDVEKIFPEFETLPMTISEDNYYSEIMAYFELLQKYLMPVIKGEKWIKDLEI